MNEKIARALSLSKHFWDNGVPRNQWIVEDTRCSVEYRLCGVRFVPKVPWQDKFVTVAESGWWL